MERAQGEEKGSKRGKGRKLMKFGFSSKLQQQMIETDSCTDTLGAYENIHQDPMEGQELGYLYTNSSQVFMRESQQSNP